MIYHGSPMPISDVMLNFYKTGPGYPAIFSPDRVYRYVLWRQWGPLPYMMVVGLNPSTADEVQDDPTVRRCIGFAKREGLGALCMTNVYGYRETDPYKMLEIPDPMGPDNYKWLAECANEAAIVLCAWGKHARIADRLDILKTLHDHNSNIYCLGINLDGSPKHPLYLAANSPLLPY